VPRDLGQEAAQVLAGGDVRDLAEARDVPVVTAAHAATAEREAAQAEAAADEAEAGAIAGTVPVPEATAARETARFTRLRAQVTARRAERTRQAQRIRELHEVGQLALKHSNELKGLRDGILADLATISELETGIRKRVDEWNATLEGYIGQASALEPEKPRPGNAPAPSSASVYAAPNGNPPVFIVRSTVLTPVKTDHVDGWEAAISEAKRETRQADPSVRLVRDGDVIVPLGRDPGGHLQRRIEAGQLHELTLDEKRAYFSGGAA
jgi:hypothetical protein